MRPLDIIGLHAPNCKLVDIDGGVQHFIDQARAGRARYVKLLWPDHTRADAELLHSLGFRIIVRAPGEGLPTVADIEAIIAEFGPRPGADYPLIEWIECGNEPQRKALAAHLDCLEAIWRECSDKAHNALIRLCTPGHGGNDAPAMVPEFAAALVERFEAIYGLFDGIGVHAYGDVVLEGGQIERLNLWALVFLDKPLLLTEVGIGANDLKARPPDPTRYAPSRLTKGERYAAFAHLVAEQVDQVEVLIIFIADAGERGPEWVQGWGNFVEGAGGVFVENGPCGYFLGMAGLERMGQRLT